MEVIRSVPIVGACSVHVPFFLHPLLYFDHDYLFSDMVETTSLAMREKKHTFASPLPLLQLSARKTPLPKSADLYIPMV